MSGEYRCLVADPPWAYDTGWPGASTSPRSAYTLPEGYPARVSLPYPSLSLAEIAALPVEELAARDAHLFLWTTNRYLLSAHEIAQEWGFRVSTILTWCKSRRGIGPGGVFASTSEFILYARRGTPQHSRRCDSTWFDWPRGEHSRKPEAFLDLVEQVCPGPYVELFARRNRLGWDTWGNEALGHVSLSAATATPDGT